VTSLTRRLGRGWARVPPTAADAALVVVLLLLAVYEYASPGDDGHQAGPLWLNAPLTVAELLPLVWRRRAPVAVFTVMCCVVALPSLVVDHTQFAYSGTFPLAFALYTVARHRSARTAGWAAVGMVATLAVYSLPSPGFTDASDVIFGTIVIGLAVGTGVVLQRLSRQKAVLADALAQLGREQEQRERLAVLAERTTLARELHDVVAHAVTLMVVQTGAARLALDDDPAAAREALLNVEHVGREATGDLRRLLGLLRDDSAADTLRPVPGIPALGALTEQMRRAGLDVRLDVLGDASAVLPPSLSASAYRVVQEALTNVLKHAGPTAVTVRIRYADPVCIEVVDEGPREVRPPAPSSGHGLAGMRERVALFGGRLGAGREDEGFAVRVELPVPPG
jgi:signal transduction histidine kinase